MAVRTETVVHYDCDLCGQEHDESEMILRYGAQQTGQRLQIDICTDCRQRAVAEVVEWFRSRRATMPPRPARRRAAPGAQRLTLVQMPSIMLGSGASGGRSADG